MGCSYLSLNMFCTKINVGLKFFVGKDTWQDPIDLICDANQNLYHLIKGFRSSKGVQKHFINSLHFPHTSPFFINHFYFINIKI